MNITVFGATGQVGKQLVKQALWKKHTVTAFGRNVFTTEFLKDDHLHLIQGALFDEQDVFHALKNTDAVLSSLGGDSTDTDNTLHTRFSHLGDDILHAQASGLI